MGAGGLRFANGGISYFRHNRLSMVTVIDTALTQNLTKSGPWLGHVLHIFLCIYLCAFMTEKFLKTLQNRFFVSVCPIMLRNSIFCISTNTLSVNIFIVVTEYHPQKSCLSAFVKTLIFQSHSFFLKVDFLLSYCRHILIKFYC